MSGHEPPSGRQSLPVPRYQGNQISGDARVQLGDTYNISRENPLSLLPFATNALFNSFDRQYESTCLPNTRVDLLQEIYDWADGQDQQYLFWLSGMAGTGKSTIAHTIARTYFEQGRLAASFFFSRGGGDAGNSSKFVTTVAVQLAVHVLPVQRYIYDAATEHSIIASQTLVDQWRQLVVRPLLTLDGKDTYPTYVMVIDALDECEGENDIRIILRLLAEARSLKKVRLRVLITSRPEVPIRYGFCQIPNAEHRDFILHDIDVATVDHDISIFLDNELRSIGQERSLGAGWPDDLVIMALVQKASGLFIWAATACRFIREGRRYVLRRLDMILQGDKSITTPENHLNEIYLTVLKNSIYPQYTEQEKGDLYSKLREVLGSIVLLFSPLSSNALATLLHIPKEDVDQTLEELYAILDIPEDRSCPLRLHHPSFRDFLLDKESCSNSNFQVNEKQAHGILADNCIRLMSNSLKQDICGQKAPGTLVTDVESSRIEQCLPPEVRYACLYWTQHLQKSNRISGNDQVYQFLQVHLLHWLEALGWIGKTSEGIIAITSLDAQILADKNPNLQAFVRDAKRFALYNRSVIEQAPLQLYCSALLFAPEKSIVRPQFEEYIPPWIQMKLKRQADWSALQTLEGHGDDVMSVAFSPDSQCIISGSRDKTVRLWDATTGAALQTLEGLSVINSVAVSPDGKQIVSGSIDGTIQLWDVTTSAVLQILRGHSKYVTSVAFSPNSKQIVSGSHDKTVRLWDAKTSVVLQTLKGHWSEVNSVAFSPDSQRIISGSIDGTVRVWDAVTGAALLSLRGHSYWVNSVAFAPDGQQIVSGSRDETVRLWDAVTGAVLQSLKGHSGWVTSVAFSPDSKLVISGSDDKTVRLWDVKTGAALQTLEGHSYWVTSVAFAPDGKQIVSGSVDRTVRLWDATTSAVLQTLEGHSDWVTSFAFSLDGKLVVSGSRDETVQLWDALTGAALQSLEGHSGRVTSVAFSPDSKVLVSGSDDETVRLWDAVTGAALKTLRGHLYSVDSVAFSPDSKLVVSGSRDKTVRLWDTTAGLALLTLKGHLELVSSVAFSPDGQRIVSGSIDRTVRLWDTITGAELQRLEGCSGSVASVTFSPNGKVLVSRSYDNTVQLWDSVTGTMLQRLKGYSGWVNSVAFLLDSKALPSLSVSDTWLAEGEANILWLPSDYRATKTAVWNRIIVLGHSLGRVSFFEIREGSKFI